MKMLHRLLASAVLLAAPLFAAAAEPNILTAEEKAAGWELLFDGKSLAGWRSYAGDAAPTGWAVEGGALKRIGKGDLMTVAEFGDFELSIEWKVAKGANSGIIYRVGTTEKSPWQTGPEYQVLDNVDGEDRVIESHRAGSLYDLIAPSSDRTKPAGEWNVAKIVVKGWQVEHWLNGQKLLETDLASDAGKAMIAGSKFKAYPKFGTLLRGHLVLQDHNNEVYFRSIKVRALK